MSRIPPWVRYIFKYQWIWTRLYLGNLCSWSHIEFWQQNNSNLELERKEIDECLNGNNGFICLSVGQQNTEAVYRFHSMWSRISLYWIWIPALQTWKWSKVAMYAYACRDNQGRFPIDMAILTISMYCKAYLLNILYNISYVTIWKRIYFLHTIFLEMRHTFPFTSGSV